MKKLKLNQMDIAPLSEKDLNNVLGGFFAVSTGGGSASSGPTCSTSTCGNADVDATNDSDKESD
ncbi:TIGR04149 family rSAM-modified RiPP [uncultured Sphingobacterium sp.]|uniref:TIGR04149 family rSAM-modified RiPP n=1 Tax=uncultured Sphingobacterium sp. TaxID=182688 RepID=UPI0037497345